VEQVDLDELDDEEAPCVALRNMSIGDVCPKESEEPTLAQDQPSSSMQVSPPTQDEDQAQDDEDQEDEPPQEEDNDQGGDQVNKDKEDEQEIQGQRPPHPRVYQAIQRDHPFNSILGDIHKGVTTRSRVAHFYEHYSFVSSIEPYRVKDALRDSDWVLAMQEELNSFDPPSDPAMVSAFVKAYPNLPRYHMWSTWDRLTAVSTFGLSGSEEEDDPDSGWDFSALNDPGAMRDFMSACDHCLSGCSDDGYDLDNEGYSPSRKCFHVDLGDHNEGNHRGMPEVDDPLGPASCVDIPRELAVVPVPTGGQDIQLEQIREMQARVDGEAGRLVQLRQNIEQEWAGRSLAGEACHRVQDIRRRIVDNARTALPPAISGSG
jgi:hypothetical protein